MTFNQWFYSADHRAKYDTDHPAYLAAREAWEAKPLTELQQDAANLLFALHDAWPYVHQWCTIESNKKRIQALMRKHGDFADLLAKEQPAQQEPVAWRVKVETTFRDGSVNIGYQVRNEKMSRHDEPLYTSPPAQRTWVGLTDEERGQAINANFGTGLWSMAKDIEAKLKEKNA